MDTEVDMKERVSNLENIGRKLCSDLRNFQKERVILSREAKCLVREIKKVEARERRYNKHKHGNNTSCTCAIWEYDLIKNEGSDHEDTTKFQKENEQFLTCNSNCGCCNALNQENYLENLLEIDECTICGFDDFDEPFHCSQSVTIIDDVDTDDDDNDSRCFDENNTVRDYINDVHCLTRSRDACTLESKKCCDICVFCKENNAKNMDASLTNHKWNINDHGDLQDLLERQRGGGGRSDSNDESPNTSICTCDCDICALRNKHGPKPPCCLRENEQPGRSNNFEYDENFQLNHPVVSELSEIHQYCKITKLREALEKLKNRNHTLRKLLKKRDCHVTNSTHYDDSNNGRDSKSLRDGCKETPGELTATLKILQSKCRTKDGMIVALADELKECASNERIKRILEKLADSSVHRDVIDFDRSTLWRYLISKKCNVMQEYSYKRKSIVANIHYQYRCTIICIFHTICEGFYRIYEILQNFQQYFASSHIMIFILENCINIFQTFLSLFNCQLGVNIEKITAEFTFFSDDGFPWLRISTIFICAAIFILYSYRACYSFIGTCRESLQYICNAQRNDVPNEYE